MIPVVVGVAVVHTDSANQRKRLSRALSCDELGMQEQANIGVAGFGACHTTRAQ